MSSNLGVIESGCDLALGVEDVTALIRRMGWAKIDHPNPNLLVYLYKDPDDRGKPIKLVLPAGNDYDDAPENWPRR
jgi:hypothetical protein